MAVAGARLSPILETLRSWGVRGVAGARVTATIPLSEEFLNDLIAASLPPSGAVRTLTVHPEPENRIGVRVRLARPEFLPTIPVMLALERQPRLPDDPRFEFRVMGLAGLLTLAVPVASLQSTLPAGIQLERDRLRVDLATLLRERGYGDVLRFVADLRLTADRGRLVIDVSASAPHPS